MRVLQPRFLAAMVAVRPLPGAPRYDGDDQRIIAQALSDLDSYKAERVDALVLENSHDLPYIKPSLPQDAIELMLEIARQARKRFSGPIGIQVREAANATALAVAKAADLDCVRVEGCVFAHVGGAG